MPGKPGTDGALDPENLDVVDIWKLYRALGPWALEHVDYEMSPTEAEETIRLLYVLEVENNRLREEYTNREKGTGVRLAWDLRD